MAELFTIAEATGEKRANVVFFHGLGCDACTTWQADKEDKATFWPAWLAQDIDGLSVYSVRYEASVSHWRGSRSVEGVYPRERAARLGHDSDLSW